MLAPLGQPVDPLHVQRVVAIAETRLGQFCREDHQLIIFSIVYKRHAATDARLAIDEAPGEEPDGGSSIDQQV